MISNLIYLEYLGFILFTICALSDVLNSLDRIFKSKPKAVRLTKTFFAGIVVILIYVYLGSV